MATTNGGGVEGVPGPWLHGIVKAVPSGDSLVLMGRTAQGGPPPEKLLQLASLVAPRLARRDPGSRDEPFACASREHLRRKLIGKPVTFRTEFVINGRDHGSVYVGDTSVATTQVAAGFAKVRGPGGEMAANYEDLQRAELAAQEAGLGMWTKEEGAHAKAVRDLPAVQSLDRAALLAQHAGKPLRGLCEAVLNGSALRVTLLDSLHTVTVFLAGVQCPAMGRRAAANGKTDVAAPAETATADTTAGEPQPEPFAREAKHYTECRVLHRELRVILVGEDKYSNMFATVMYDGGEVPSDIAAELVSLGLARVVDWSAAMMTTGAAKLRSAERAAKEGRVRLWRDWAPPPSTVDQVRGSKQFIGTVVEVVSGDTVVAVDPSGAERRITLSSVRAPRMGNPRRDIKGEPYSEEAKEFVRSRLIGKKVAVAMEYVRKVPGAEGAPDRVMEMASVHVDKDAGVRDDDAGQLNVAEALVVRGFATVVRHRGDEERSAHYDDLVSAEERAKKARKGVHSSKDPPIHRVNDVSQSSSAKAKQFLPFLQRAGTVTALVELVISGHRFKLLVEKEHLAITFSLSGVRTPGRSREGGDEPFGPEALRFARHACLQRHVELDVEGIDKTGTFLGQMRVGGQSLATRLLESGLASIHPMFNAARAPNGRELADAEAAAKAAKRGVWENYDEEAEKAKQAAAEADEAGTVGSAVETLEVGVTEVIGGGLFYVQAVSEASSMAAIEAGMADLSLGGSPSPPGFAPRPGDVVAGRFSGDGSWYRAHIERASGGEFDVFYIDYGNTERLKVDNLRPLPPVLAAGAPKAKLCTLAFLKMPSLDEDFGYESAEMLGEQASGRTFTASVHFRDRTSASRRGRPEAPELRVDLVDAQGTSVSEALVAAGLARLEKRRGRPPPGTEALAAVEEQARKSRAMMWQYGDIDDEDDEPAPAAQRRK